MYTVNKQYMYIFLVRQVCAITSAVITIQHAKTFNI